MRIVDQNASGDAQARAILAHLGANYGEAVKLTYPAHQWRTSTNEFTHRKVSSTARKQFEAKQTPMSAARTQREQELEERAAGTT